MTAVYYFVRPTDSLFVRGNLAFGDGGEHGASEMPPPPSLFAGAFRSALLGKNPALLGAFAQADGATLDAALGRCLGTPDVTGEFRVSWLSLAVLPGKDAAMQVFVPLPSDLQRLGENFAPVLPQALPEGVQSAGSLPLRATLRSAKQEKPSGGLWLGLPGLRRHLSCEMPVTGEWVEQGSLFRRDPRLGIGLDASSRTAQEGQIYTTEGLAFSPAQNGFDGTGFLIGVEGMGGLLPDQGLLRLGGDGRSASYSRVDFSPPMAPRPVGSDGRFRLLLQTPGLFKAGWIPDRVQGAASGQLLEGDGFRARLVCATMGRREVVSGWDLHAWKPKPAQCMVPAGSVYWFDQFRGDAGKLAAWVQSGLWSDNIDNMQRIRRAEGYNRAWLGAWL